MTPETQRAAALLDELIAGWEAPVVTADYAHSYELRPEQLLRIAAICGSLEGSAHGDHRLQFVLGKTARRVYEVRDGVGKLRSVLALLANLIDEARHPELLTLGSSSQDEARKYALRENNPHGFQTLFSFDLDGETVPLSVETANGLPVSDRIEGYGFRIEREKQDV